MEIDYRCTGIDKFVREFPWVYYQPVERGFKCKVCQIFPALSSGKGKNLFVEGILQRCSVKKVFLEIS